MTDNLKPAAPARFYGFAHGREHFVWRNPDEAGAPAALQAAAEPAPATSSELVHVPRDEQIGLPDRRLVEPGRSVPSAEVEVVIDATIASPPPEEAPEPTKKRKRRKKKRQRPTTVREEPPLSSLAMHEAHCMICGSDCQEEMDELFVNWHNVSEIGREYTTPRRVIYRHAHATGLFPIRDRNLRRALGLIIHRAETAPGVTADSVIRAVRTLAHINDAGEWVNPPTEVVFSTVPQRTDQVRCPERSRGAELSPCPEQSRGALPSADLLDTPCQAIESVKP
jgi:hypothetical protein